MPDTILYLAAGLAVTETVGITNFTGSSDSDGIRGGDESPINISPPDITLPTASGGDFGEIGDIFDQMSSQLGGFSQIQQQLAETRQAIQSIGQNPQESVDNSVSGFAEGFTSAIDSLGSGFELPGDTSQSDSPSESPSNPIPTDTTQTQAENNGFLYNIGNNLGSAPGNLTAGILEGIETGFEESIDWGEEQGERINSAIWGQSSDPLSNILKGENAIEGNNSRVNDIVNSIAKGNDMSGRQKAKEQGKIVDIPALGGEVPKSFAENVAEGNVNMDVYDQSQREELPTKEELDERDPWSDYDPSSIGV